VPPTPAPTPNYASQINNAAGDISFTLGAGTFPWSNEVFCKDQTITLTGAGKGVTIMDAGGAHRFFTLKGNCKIVLNHLTMQGGDAGNGAGGVFTQDSSYSSSDKITATMCEFRDNMAGDGGVVYHAPALWQSCSFTNNRATRVRAPRCCSFTTFCTHPPSPPPHPCTPPCPQYGGVLAGYWPETFNDCSFTKNRANIVRLLDLLSLPLIALIC
jgi:hypothetical protein